MRKEGLALHDARDLFQIRPFSQVAAVWLAAVVALFALDLLIPRLVASFGLSLSGEWGRVGFDGYSALTYGAAAAAAWHMTTRRWRIGGGWDWGLLIRGAVGGAVLGAMVSLMAFASGKWLGFPWPSDIHDLLNPVASNRRALGAEIGILLVISPPMEEWLFRGVLQTSLSRAFNHWSAIPVVAVVFALAHELDTAHPLAHPWLWLPLLPLAFALGIVGANIGVHVGYNVWAAAWILGNLFR